MWLSKKEDEHADDERGQERKGQEEVAEKLEATKPLTVMHSISDTQSGLLSNVS